MSFKYRELSDDIVTKAKIIIGKVELEKAKQLNDMLNEAIPVIVDDLYERDNKIQQALLSNLFFQKAIITTSIRGLIDEEDCNCTPHPGHLVGKSYFACQEDIFYDYKTLKQLLIDYDKTIFEQDEKDEKDEIYALIAHVNTFEGAEDIRFDDFYSFYIPKKILCNHFNELKSYKLCKYFGG